jgi:hypothetical protein
MKTGSLSDSSVGGVAVASTRPGLRRAAKSDSAESVERIARERDEARHQRDVLANDIMLLEQALLEIERAAGNPKAVLAIVHRVLGEPQERAG